MIEVSPERALVLSYAPRPYRAALGALLALDDVLGRLLRTTREPAIAQIRLAWWRERIAELDETAPPAEPVLLGLAREVLPLGVSGRSLAGVVEGWEVLIEEEELDAGALARFGEGRGARLFEAAGLVLGAGAKDPLAVAGRGWALADLSRNLSDPVAAAEARHAAAAALREAVALRWGRAARPLGAMAHLARLDLAVAPGAMPPIGSPGRVGRLLWHRLTGR